MEAVLDDAYLLITDKKISVIQDILPLLGRSYSPARSSSSLPKMWRARLCPR
ncbi:MAG: hypothetical protein ACLSWY_15085 [Ruthenibacterium lactatiformans]